MSLGSTQPLTEIRGILSGGKDGRCVGLTILPPSCADCVEILGASTSWTAVGLLRNSFTFILPLRVTRVNISDIVYGAYGEEKKLLRDRKNVQCEQT